MVSEHSKEDPLKSLIVDAKEVDRSLLASCLRGKTGVDAETGEVHLLSGFHSLNARQKVLTVLLGRKAAFLLGLSDSEYLAAKDVIRESGLPDGTVYPTLKRLKDERIASQDHESRYYVPSTQLHVVARELEVD